MNGAEGDPVGRVTAYLHGVGGRVLEPAPGEWGLVVEDVGGRPLEIGLRLAGGLLRAQAWVAPPGAVEPRFLLHRNRLGVVARYGCSAAGDVWAHAELAACAVCDTELDRLLGSLVEAAATVRER